MTVTTDQIRILIVDDHPVEGLGIRSSLESQDHLEILGETAVGAGAVDEVRRLKPDVVIIDASHPENALDATRQILDASPQTEVLVMTLFHSVEIAQQVLQAGARAYVLESDGVQSLVAAITALSRHKPFFTGELAEEILDSYMRRHESADGEEPRTPKITPREREIIQLLCEGNSNKETASRLNISVKTVEAHRLNIMRKLRLNSLSHLVRYAIREGIVAA
jgi:DNA-binding NarL/FixJ family response regulator